MGYAVEDRSVGNCAPGRPGDVLQHLAHLDGLGRRCSLVNDGDQDRVAERIKKNRLFRPVATDIDQQNIARREICQPGFKGRRGKLQRCALVDRRLIRLESA